MEFRPDNYDNVFDDSDRSPTPDELARRQTAMDFAMGQAARIREFQERAKARGLTGLDAVIALINVDDPVGGQLAGMLMPGHDWQPYRDAGETPVARGLASKRHIHEFLSTAGYATAAAELESAQDIQVLVLHSELALVLDVRFDEQQ